MPDYFERIINAQTGEETIRPWTLGEVLAAEAAAPPPRSEMRAYRLAFEDAAAGTPYGEGTLLDAIDGLVLSLGPAAARRYQNITIFERLRPEVTQFLIAGLGLTDEQVDDLFVSAMALEAGAQ